MDFKHNKYQPELFCNQYNNTYSLQISNQYFMDAGYKDSILKIIDDSRLEQRGRYRYSDLGFIYLQRIIERISKKPLDVLADSLFYKPLWLASTTYHPLKKTTIDRIAPTENDTFFRKELVKGYVHDQTAAMLGGVSGNAGLFSNANDLGVIMQMLINNGTYAGNTFLKKETIEVFNTRPYDTNKRALGWDKPELDIRKNGSTSSLAPQETFGHTGFTGTCMWADPVNQLVFVFLSNRVYPSAENHKLVDMNVRTKIQDAIYQSFVRKSSKYFQKVDSKN